MSVLSSPPSTRPPKMSLVRNRPYSPLTHVVADPESDWLKMPEWESNDEFTDTKTYAWVVLTSSILDSIMTSTPTSKTVLTAPWAVSVMAGGRLWLMSDEPMLADESMLNKNDCLCALNISEMALKQHLCHLWLRWDKRIGSTMWRHLKAARAALKRERGHNRGIHRGPNRCAAAREHAMLMKASEVRRRSMAWVESDVQGTSYSGKEE